MAGPSLARALLLELLDIVEGDEEIRGRVRALLASEVAPERPRLLDRAELARALGVSTATLDRLRKRPHFPHVPVGDLEKFELEPVLRWLRAQGSEPAQGPNVVDIRRKGRTK